MTLPRLTSLRWYAALLVFLFHMSASMPWRPFKAFQYGQTGVSFFFVLSGFVLTWSAGGPGARRFYWNRFSRIYPSHMVMLVIAATLIAMGVPVGHSDALGLTTGSLLVQAWFPGLFPNYAENGVSWSLSVEAFFYLCFPLAIVHFQRARLSRLLASGACALVLGASATVILASTGHSQLAYHLPIVRLPEFVLGMALASVIQRGWLPKIPVSPTILLVIVVGLVARSTPLFPVLDYVLLLPYVLVILAAVGRDLRGAKGLLATRAATYLGEISFAFYLVHQTVLESVLDVAGNPRDPSAIAGASLTAACLLAAIASAVLLHHAVERPAQRALRAWTSASRQRA